MEAIYLKLLSLILFLGSTSTLFSSCASADNGMLVGEYKLVDIRRASDVAGGPLDEDIANLLGSSAFFDKVLILPGEESCESWSITESPDNAVNIGDPMLSDTQIPPLSPDVSAGEKRVNISLNLTCNDEVFYSLLKVDERVLIAPTDSGLGYLLFERPLSESETKKLQFQLKDMKFYSSGSPTETWDKDSLYGLASYAHYRGSEYRFNRTVITENILDGLRVLNHD